MITIWENYTQQNPETYAPVDFPILEDEVTEVVYAPFCRDLMVQITVAGLASGESATGRLEGSLTGIGDEFDNLAADGEDTVITVNGTTLLFFDGACPPYFRASGFTPTNEDSEATIDIKFHLARMA